MGIKVWRLEEIPEDADRLPAGYVSLADAAKWLGVTTEALRKAIRSGRLAAERERSSGKQGWRYVVRTADLNRWRRERRT
jgi:hypothetical protein